MFDKNLNFLLSDRWKIVEIAFTWARSSYPLWLGRTHWKSSENTRNFCLSSSSCSGPLTHCCRHCVAKNCSDSLIYFVPILVEFFFHSVSCLNLIRLPGVFVITVVLDLPFIPPFFHPLHLCLFTLWTNVDDDNESVRNTRIVPVSREISILYFLIITLKVCIYKLDSVSFMHFFWVKDRAAGVCRRSTPSFYLIKLVNNV